MRIIAKLIVFKGMFDTKRTSLRDSVIISPKACSILKFYLLTANNIVIVFVLQVTTDTCSTLIMHAIRSIALLIGDSHTICVSLQKIQIMAFPTFSFFAESKKTMLNLH